MLNFKQNIYNPMFQFQVIDPRIIETDIKKLKCSKSAGHDKVPANLLKDTVGILSKPLSAVSNSSFETGTFPYIWKIARLTSFFKSGQKNNMNNYKSISVLFVFSRMLHKWDMIKSHTT